MYFEKGQHSVGAQKLFCAFAPDFVAQSRKNNAQRGAESQQANARSEFSTGCPLRAAIETPGKWTFVSIIRQLRIARTWEKDTTYLVVQRMLEWNGCNPYWNDSVILHSKSDRQKRAIKEARRIASARKLLKRSIDSCPCSEKKKLRESPKTKSNWQTSLFLYFLPHLSHFLRGVLLLVF